MNIYDGTQDFQGSEGQEGDGSVETTGKVRSGRVNGKNSQWQSGGTRIHKKLNNEIMTILMANQDKAAKKNKKVGAKTQEKREMGWGRAALMGSPISGDPSA